MRGERRKWPCLRCGIDVTEYRGVCNDCQAFVRKANEGHLWFEPKDERRARMKFLAQIGLVTNPDRRRHREGSRVHREVHEVRLDVRGSEG